MVYRVIIEKDEDFGYVVHCPAIPGCHSQGNTIEEAIENIKDAIRGCLSVLDEEAIIPIKELGAMEIEVRSCLLSQVKGQLELLKGQVGISTVEQKVSI